MKKKYQNKNSKLPKWPQKKLQFELEKLFQRQSSKRLSAKQIAQKLHIANSRDSILAAIEKLEQKGSIQFVKEGKYTAKKGTIQDRGKYQGIVDMTKSGAGYILVDDLESDIYVPVKRMRTALNRDVVSVRITGKFRGKLEGEIIEVLERRTTQFVGRFMQSHSYGFVIPTDHNVPFDVFVHPDHQLGAGDQQYVMVDVYEWPKRKDQNPMGKVVQLFDKNDFQELSMQSILVQNGFSQPFDAEVEESAKQLKREIDAVEIAKRRDFRNITTFTIDPLTAKDFDDALSIQHLEDGLIEVGVHIADVTHYVKEGDLIDREAYDRATSVYLVDRVAPMLPETLSNELCSLRPQENSLTFSAVFTFHPKTFEIKHEWIGRTVIYSDHRFTYAEAQEEIDSGTGIFVDELRLLNEIAKKLRRDRFGEGSIGFESQELNFVLDDKNQPVDVQPKQVLDTNKMIEDFMLLANKCVAKFIGGVPEKAVPYVYRIHDLPDKQRLDEFAVLAKELDFHADFSTPERIVYTLNRLHEEAAKNPGLQFLDQLAIRAMAKAEYNIENIGHFGLGFAYYTHFTSPIRRYADVLVHRILFQNLEKMHRVDPAKLAEQCAHISAQERKAIDAERQSVKWMQVRYMEQFIGETFNGRISGLIDRGIFVELLDNLCEGMVPFDQMGESYVVSESRLKAFGTRTGKVLRMGDIVRVKVIDADIEKRQIEFEWAVEDSTQ